MQILNKSSIWFLFCLILKVVLLVGFSGCDMRRDNPLDPKAYNYGGSGPVEIDLPVLKLTSFHSSQWFPSEDIYSVEVLVSGTLAETADSVSLIYQDSIYFSLINSGNEWKQSLESSSLGEENLFDLIGVMFYAELYYGDVDTISTEESCLYRIIDEVPFADEPSGNMIVSPTPVFSWLSMDLNYTFSYSLSINHISISGFITEVASIENISSDSLSYTYTDSLESGSYYWTIAVRDIYSNMSRSREAAFIVVQ